VLGALQGGTNTCNRPDAKCTHRRNDWNWEALAQLEYARSSKRTRENGLGRLEVVSYKGRADHDGKIRSRKQRTDIGKCSFVNKTIQL
jgi:hypothetical protein